LSAAHRRVPSTVARDCRGESIGDENLKKRVRPGDRVSVIYMASIEEVDILDSGMGSSDVRSPEVKSILPPDDIEDEEDETLAERLVGLTEMFPEEVRKLGYNFGSGLYRCVKGLYGFSCSATWLFFSSSAILFAPVIFEIERSQMEEAQRAQQKQVLLGPKTAMSNVGSGMPMAPPVQR